MAVWYARQSSVNINAANVWNSAADGSGSWLTWPPAANDVLMANGQTIIQFNVNTSVAEIRTDTANGATAGGHFRCTVNGVSVTATLYTGSSATYAVYMGAAGTFAWVGDIYGGSGSSWRGVVIDASGITLNVTGNLYGGSGSGAHAVDVNRAGSTCNVTGSATGGAGSNSSGLHNTSTGTVNLTGTATGGASAFGVGVRNVAGGAATVTGNAIASAGAGVRNVGAGTLTLTGYAQASTTQAGAINDAQGVLTVGETRSASNGRGAVLGAFRFASATAAKSLPIIAGSQRTLSVLDVAALVPAVEDVRANVIYGDGAYTGTLALQRKRQNMAGRF